MVILHPPDPKRSEKPIEKIKTETPKREKSPTQPDKRGTAESPVVVEVPPPPNTKDKSNRQAHERQEDRVLDRQMVLLTLSIAVISLLLAIVSGYQAYIARDTARRQLRAYVGIVSVRLIRLTDPEVLVVPMDDGLKRMPSFNFVVKNCGQTPAFDLSMQAYFEIIPGSNKPLPDDFVFSDRAPGGRWHESKITLWPGQETPFREAVDELVLQRIINGEMTLYLYGWVTYIDSFKKTQVSRCCYLCLADGGTFGIRTLPRHNDAT